MPQQDGDGNSSQPTAAERRAEAKKPYQKPSFRQQKIFETMALQCGKMQSTQGSCHLNRKNS
jgi:hypothetical protein